MTFEEMLDHALAMLQRRGRLTYRTLQRQFHLDDDALNDLKDALLYAHPEVHDDAGRGLVWTGESSRASQRALAGLVRYYGDAGVLVLVRALLQREGRLSYRSLARICGLDEAGLADFREDLLFQRLARDEDGKGLVWIRERTASWPGRHGLRQRHACRLGCTSTGRGQHPNRAGAGRAQRSRLSRAAAPSRPNAGRSR